MNLDYFREFVVAAKRMSFTQAAKELYMTQPKISVHIAQLEKDLGFSLFERSGGLALTREGKIMFEAVTRSLEQFDLLVERCRKSNAATPQKLTFAEFSMFDMLPPTSLGRYADAVAELCERHPSLDYTVIPLENTSTIFDYFDQGLCDIAFRTYCLESASEGVKALPDGTSVLPLEMDPFVVWMRVDHPLSVFDSLSIQQVADYPILFGSCESLKTHETTRRDFFALHDVQAMLKCKKVSTPSSFATPIKNDDLSLIPTSFAHSPRAQAMTSMTVRPIVDTKAQSCFCLCFPTGSQNPFVEELVGILRG